MATKKSGTKKEASQEAWSKRAQEMAAESKGRKSEEMSEEELAEVEAALKALRSDRGVIQKEILVEWEANERPFRALGRDVVSTIVAGVALLGVILWMIDGIVPVMMLASFVFMWYVFGTVKPGRVTHKLTTWGLETEEKVWMWEYMNRYWFEGEGETRVMTVEMVTGWPRFVRFVIDTPETEAALRREMMNYVIEDKPRENWLDKASKWLEGRIDWSVR